jgi:hypothetical protein
VLLDIFHLLTLLELCLLEVQDMIRTRQQLLGLEQSPKELQQGLMLLEEMLTLKHFLLMPEQHQMQQQH